MLKKIQNNIKRGFYEEISNKKEPKKLKKKKEKKDKTKKKEKIPE